MRAFSVIVKLCEGSFPALVFNHFSLLTISCWAGVYLQYLHIPWRVQSAVKIITSAGCCRGSEPRWAPCLLHHPGADIPWHLHLFIFMLAPVLQTMQTLYLLTLILQLKMAHCYRQVFLTDDSTNHRILFLEKRKFQVGSVYRILERIAGGWEEAPCKRKIVGKGLRFWQFVLRSFIKDSLQLVYNVLQFCKEKFVVAFFS